MVSDSSDGDIFVFWDHMFSKGEANRGYWRKYQHLHMFPQYSFPVCPGHYNIYITSYSIFVSNSLSVWMFITDRQDLRVF
jgi:hypothetical protein